MATNTHLSAAAWDAALNAITALANGGSVTVYDGAQPAGPDTPLSGQNALVTMGLSSPAAGAAVAGVATMNAVTSAPAAMSGTATWFRVYASGGAAVWDGSVGTSGADMNFPSTAFVATALYGVSSWTFAMAPGG